MNHSLISILSISVTTFIFFLAKKLNNRFPHPLTLPILTSTVVLIIGLLLFQIPYETYMIGGKWIESLLGPAVVALAIPLYQHQKIIIQYTFPILCGTLFGSIVGVVSGYLFGKLFGFEKLVLLSLLPKSVTSPVAMDIARTIEGSPTLAAVLVMIAGITGAVVGHTLFQKCKLHHPIARGLGMGSASHAIGTARSMEFDFKEGAASTVAMVLSAIFTSFITPLFVLVLL